MSSRNEHITILKQGSDKWKSEEIRFAVVDKSLQIKIMNMNPFDKVIVYYTEWIKNKGFYSGKELYDIKLIKAEKD